MNINGVKFTLLVLSAGFCLLGHAQPNQGMQTFSPYTPEQIKAFNQQSLSPIESPFGPVGASPEQARSQGNASKAPKTFNVPVGEQEAEAIETQSAEPYEPMTPTISF